MQRSSKSDCEYGYHIGDEDKQRRTKSHGSLLPFDSITEDWRSYVQHMNYYAMNNVDDGAKKLLIMLSACGAITYIPKLGRRN